MIFWHHQLMKHTDKESGEVWYAVHEYFPSLGEGSYTLGPIRISGESVEDIKWQLKAILGDIDKYGVIEYE